MSNSGIFLTAFFDHCETYLHYEKKVRNITKLDQIEKFWLPKKAVMVPKFWLIGKSHHNFLVLRMIDLACKIFMPIQTLDLDRVIWHNVLLCKQVPQKKTEMVSDPSWQHCVVEQQCMLLKCTPYKKTLLVPSKLSNTFSYVLKPKVAIYTNSIDF